ncbi:hypothetical protein P8452_38165 [Trifolium repens]|nr:hypothetical protein P8452_38165 [Trifolium repens]
MSYTSNEQKQIVVETPNGHAIKALVNTMVYLVHVWVHEKEIIDVSGVELHVSSTEQRGKSTLKNDDNEALVETWTL